MSQVAKKTYTPEQEKLYTWRYDELVDAIKSNSKPKSENNPKPLSAAMFQKMLERALKQGFPIDYRPHSRTTTALYYMTLLNYAVQKKNEELAWMLLDHGADVNAQGDNCLICASRSSYISPELFREIANRTKMIKHIDPNIAPLQILSGEYIYQNTFDQYPQDEVQANRLERIKILIEAGVSLDDFKEDYFRRSWMTQAVQERFQFLKQYIYTVKEQTEQMNNSPTPTVYDYEL